MHKNLLDEFISPFVSLTLLASSNLCLTHRRQSDFLSGAAEIGCGGDFYVEGSKVRGVPLPFEKCLNYYVHSGAIFVKF